MEGQGLEIYDMPEHGPDGAAAEWPIPNAPASDGLLASDSSSVASEIDRLLDAARDALEQVPSEPLTPSVDEVHWPEWSSGVSVRSEAASSASADHAAVRIVIGRFALGPAELANFRGREAVRLAATALGLVEIHAGGRLRARGTLVVMEDRFGVRITELVANAMDSGSN